MPCNPDFPNLLLVIQTFVFSKLSVTQTNKFFLQEVSKSQDFTYTLLLLHILV